MKTKTTLGILTLVVSMLLTACAGAAATATAAPATAAPTAEPTSAFLADLGGREITVAVENAYLPFNYITKGATSAAGWDYDVIPAICVLINCKPVFVEASWDTMIQSVADGLFDVAGDGITINEERSKNVDFSDGYVSVEQRLLVRKGETRFADMDAFSKNVDLILGTQVNTTNYETAAGLIPETRIKAFDTFPFAVQALISGDIDAVIIDEIPGMGYVAKTPDALELVGPTISSDQLGFAFPKGSELVAPFNLAIAAMKADGSLEAINNKYFGPDFILTYDDIE